MIYDTMHEMWESNLEKLTCYYSIHDINEGKMSIPSTSKYTNSFNGP